MGGAVSSGRDNNELIDNLMRGNYIRSRHVERVFRAVDRADYMTPEARDQAYKDLAWRNGPLHMSAPCIYSEVMEGLQLKPGLSFLNVGSGTGYLSTLVGLVIGASGINHGIEVHSQVVEYANKKLQLFLENSATLDEFDFCEPKFYCGNGLCLAPLQTAYDRVYCGAGCPEEYQTYFEQLIKVGGVLVMPLNDNLLKVKRLSATEWSSCSVLNVSFATLRVPTKDEDRESVRLEEQSPGRLQALSRAVIRECMRGAMRRRHPELREPPPRAPPAKKACPRRICIPLEGDSDTENLNALHDLDSEGGANEMNALLSLVLSMGRNRVAGALRVDPIDSESSTEEAEDVADDDDDDDGGDDDAPGNDGDASVLLAAEGNSDLQSSPEGSRTENPENAERSETPAVDQNNRDSRPDRSNRRDRSSRSERAERSDSGHRADRAEPRDRSARSDRGRGDRSDRSDRGDREGRRDRADRRDIAPVRSVFMFEIRSNPSRRQENSEANNTAAAINRDPADNARELSTESAPELTEEAKESTSQEAPRGVATPPRNRNNSRRNFRLICRRNRRPREPRISGSQSPDDQKDGEQGDHENQSIPKMHADADIVFGKTREEKQSNPEVPAEEDIVLGKTREEPGTSSMEWQAAQAKAEEKTEGAEGAEPKEQSSEEDTETTTSKNKEEKRQKLDSGIGGGDTGSASSSDRGSPSPSPSPSHSHCTHTDTDTQGDSTMDDEGVDSDVRGRRRRQKRGHLSTRSSSSTDEEDEEDDDGFDLSLPPSAAPLAPRSPRDRPRRQKRRSHADDPRRLTLSLYMKQGVKELPLPHPLQKYVNLDRVC